MTSESAAEFQRRFLSSDVAELAFDAVFYLTGVASAVGTPQQPRDRLVQGLEHIQNVLESVRQTEPDFAAPALVRTDALLTVLRQTETGAPAPTPFSEFFGSFGLHPPFLEVLESARKSLAD